MDCENLRQTFLNRERVEGVEYQQNDYVRVTDGKYKGRSGSLISLEAIAPEPTFLVELEDGGDVEVRQSQLIFISHD
jgi:ribosomal protein S4E